MEQKPVLTSPPEANISIKDVDFDLSAEGLAPWSFSKLKSLEKCPFQFYLKYLYKLKVIAVVMEGLPIAEIGSAAHKILELVIAGKSMSDSYKSARQSYIASINDEYWKSHVETLELNIQNFLGKLDSFEKVNPVKRLLPELRLGIDSEWNPVSFWDKRVFFRGIIDLLVQLENKDGIIIDHKTGGGEFASIKNHKAQLDTYKVLIHFGLEKLAGAQAGIHYIREGKVILDEYAPKEEIETRLKDRLMYFINSAIDSVKEAGYFKHKRGAYCQYCEFNDPCKAGDLLSIEKDTKKYFPIKLIKSE